MVRTKGGKWIPPEGLRLYKTTDDEGAFFTYNKEEQVEQYIPLGSPIEVSGRRGIFCELTLHSKTKRTEQVVLFDEDGELLRVAKIPRNAKVIVYRNGAE